MPCTRPDFGGALFNFRLFLKLGAPSCLGPGASCPPCPPPLSAALVLAEFTIVAMFKLLIIIKLYQNLGAMLATQLNHMVNENKLDAKAIIRLDKYICNVIQGTR